MKLFEMESERPKEGQITRAVIADIPLLPKKEPFHVYRKDIEHNAIMWMKKNLGEKLIMMSQ